MSLPRLPVLPVLEPICIRGYNEFKLDSLEFDDARYEDFLRQKLDYIASKLSDFELFDNSYLTIDMIDVFPSPIKHYRERCRFQIVNSLQCDSIFIDSKYSSIASKHNFQKSTDCTCKLNYAVWDKGGPNAIIADFFPIASRLICMIMQPLIYICGTDIKLSENLTSISFLSTLFTGEIIITMIYSHPISCDLDIDSSWKTSAIHLKSCLKEIMCSLLLTMPIHDRIKFEKVKIVGRSKGIKICISDDGETTPVSSITHVWELFQLNDGRQLQYKQVDEGFSNPNAFVNKMALEWISNATKEAIENINNKGNDLSHHINIDLLEMYCGNGNHTVALAGIVDRIVAVELNKSLCLAAQENLQVNSITNAEIISCDSSKFAMNVLKAKYYINSKGERYDFRIVLVDPPRCGLDEKTRTLITWYDFIIYISCNPDALRRDLLEICKSHNILKIAVFDQFAYTPHVECGVLLARKILS